MSKDPNGNQGQELHSQRRESTHDCHSHWGSCWADSEAARIFRAQSAQFDTSTKSFRKSTCPSVPQLILVIHRESCTSQLVMTDPTLLLLHIRLHNTSSRPHSFKSQSKLETSCNCKIMEGHQVENRTTAFESLWKFFYSLGVFTKGTKINSLNKLCHQFNNDILAGC